MSRKDFENIRPAQRNRGAERKNHKDADFRKNKPKTKPKDKEYGRFRPDEEEDWIPENVTESFR